MPVNKCTSKFPNQKYRFAICYDWVIIESLYFGQHSQVPYEREITPPLRREGHLVLTTSALAIQDAALRFYRNRSTQHAPVFTGTRGAHMVPNAPHLYTGTILVHPH